MADREPSRIVSDSLIIPLGFDSSPGHKISNCGSPLTSSIYICVYIYIYIYIYIYKCCKAIVFLLYC